MPINKDYNKQLLPSHANTFEYADKIEKHYVQIYYNESRLKIFGYGKIEKDYFK